jgi:hypothetical protein
MIKQILYDVKTTSANTTYYNISKEDMDWILGKLIQMQAYMGELSLTKNKGLKDLVRWYTAPKKSLPRAQNWQKYNSPQSFISGVLNNIMFGEARDISDITASNLENIISVFAQIVDAVKETETKDLQIQIDNDTVLFQQNLWDYK